MTSDTHFFTVWTNGSAESIFGAAPIRSSATASIFVSRLRNARAPSATG
jgi:hypothetical protein